MNNKRHYINPLTLILTLGLLISACGGSSTQEKQPQASTQNIPSKSQPSTLCLMGIQPGQTSRAEVISQMGESTFSYTSETGFEVLEYPSSIEEIPTSIFIKEDVVQIISVLVEEDTETVTKLKGELGEPEKTTYSFFGQGTLTYIYPQKGVAAIVDEETDQLLWLQCFAPMPLADYMGSWGSQLPLENPYIR